MNIAPPSQASRWFRGLALAACTLLANPPSFAAEDKLALAQQKELIEYATDVMTPAPENFYKWAASPIITCVADAAPHKPLIEDFLREVSPAFEGLPVQPVLGPDSAQDAAIFVVIGTDQAMRDVAQKYGDRPQKGGETWRYNWTTEKQKTSFRIYIDKAFFEKLRPEGQRFLIYRRLLCALGFIGSSEGLKDAPSIFTPKYWEIVRRPSGPPPALSGLDLKLVRFGYQVVPNDARKQTVRELVRKNWVGINLPGSP